ncbi:hypothetical protein CLAFUW4_12887 [Fulvia fulva]|uniref:DUF7730 domain-containing protein n=1 Tax=Passalora fulva TaxID=5499 RepID=A0A9Q8PJU8_PASFU|nr:uncharacterized protein CLAFUR5_12753 [Fulvia fulva]KAK4612240.1 hypothetical protein CLAFUR4_12891 [Fulvia fulva]KAK4612765.1 hypothetical protein CLAFUR0_12897 [Fulvia fulva]UJO23856.1 hypothetical protein CLAFUR5_12753 [Fulvia fulva]WPV21413.1 hypothetical protein CLAFUW4_12887 [Fulvia fulva]WPV36530.1 hypothetical protein CLAFUW7_12894 [Fulvia fulva]
MADSNSTPTTFLSLPPELRNEIYKLAIDYDDEICVTGKSERDLHATNARGAAVLRSCRQVHDELVAILYGSNTFVFTEHGALLTFLRVAGAHTKHLRKVSVKWIWSSDIRECLILLREATQLEMLELPCAAVSMYYSTKSAVSLMQGLLQMHEKAGTEAVLDVVRFTQEPPPKSAFLYPNFRTDDSYVRALRSMLAKALQLPGKH